jgi:hypothetical protein
MDIRKALVLGGVMAAAFGVPATAASASVAVFPFPSDPGYGHQANAFTATTSITNHPDSGGGGHIWANDAMTRTLTIKETGHQGSVYTYTATVSDTGTFKTTSGAYTPNQGGTNLNKKINGIVQGSMSGTAYYSFTASNLPTRRHNLGVPASESGTPTGAQTTSLWYEQAFPAGTTFSVGSGLLNTWSWTYVAGSAGHGCTQGNDGKDKGNGHDSGYGWPNGNGNSRGQGCTCGGDHGRGRDNSKGKDYGKGNGCTQRHDNQSQDGYNKGQDGNSQGNRGKDRGGKNGNQGSSPSKSSAQQWVDAYSNNGGQDPTAGNITG